VLTAFGDRYSLYGGSAANSLKSSSMGYQFADDRLLESSLVVALLEYEFEMDGRMDHGFLPLKRDFVSVDGLATEGATSDYVVTILDAQPALDCLSNLNKEVAFTCPKPTLGLGGGENAHIVTTLEPLDELVSRGEKAVRFSRKVTLGYRLSVLNASAEELHGRSIKAFDAAFQRMSKVRDKVRLLIGLACIGRFCTYERQGAGHWFLLVDRFADLIPDVPVVQGLVAGEFGSDHRRRPRADNLSLWMAWLTSAPHDRSRSRLNMLRLLEVADELIQKSSVEEVMQAAIDCPMQGLADGGQICTYDPETRKILGGKQGYGNSRPGSGINSELLIDSMTRLAAAEGVTYTMPEKLRAWSMPTGPRPKALSEEDPYEQKADILSLAVANRVAVFVPDSADPTFLCDLGLVVATGLGPQFAMPLTGRDGQMIATLQIFFPLRHHMSRSELAQWVSYGQKVGIALERAQEYGNRAAAESLSRLASKIMQRPAPKWPFPEEEVKEFLALLQDLSKADYVHLRIREGLGGACRFRLVAPVGKMAFDHGQKRLYVERGQGSLFHLLDKPELATHTLAETKRTYALQPELQRTHLSESGRWCLAGTEFQTFWLRLLGTPDLPLGCLAVHSTLEHFFTKPRRELLRYACRILQTLIEKREADFNERKLKERESAILLLALLSSRSFHDVFGALANIRRSAELVMEICPNDESVCKEMRDVVKLVGSLVSQLQRRGESVGGGAYTTTLRDLIGQAKKEMKRKWNGREDMEGEQWDCLVEAHPAVRGAIAQLLDNAVEHTLGAVNAVWIGTLKLSKDGARVTFLIENEGERMDREAIEKMRQIGYTSKGREEHSGFGIPIAEVALMHLGGELKFEPREEGGLVAEVRLVVAGKPRD
jgi:signal transduction histidine kinase